MTHDPRGGTPDSPVVARLPIGSHLETHELAWTVVSIALGFYAVYTGHHQFAWAYIGALWSTSASTRVETVLREIRGVGRVASYVSRFLIQPEPWWALGGITLGGLAGAAALAATGQPLPSL